MKRILKIFLAAAALFAALSVVSCEEEYVRVGAITINPKTARLKVGGTLQLNATLTPENANYDTITWESWNTAYATVDENGVVTGVGQGWADIVVRVTEENGISHVDNCKIEIYE
ncbi:MAG: Ig-like domain-containing protein [Bacteroidales bacterium]|nr:Ig-like domain-containing protein [Bacteroidales bacterium]